MHPSSSKVFPSVVTILISWCLTTGPTCWAISFELPELEIVGNHTTVTSGSFEILLRVSPWELPLDINSFNIDLVTDSPLMTLGPATPSATDGLFSGGTLSDFSPDAQTVRAIHTVANAVPLADNKVLAEIPFDIAAGQEGTFALTFGLFNAMSDTAGQILLPDTSTSGSIEVLLPISQDYNLDGLWNAADYTIWQDSLGDTGIDLLADGTGSGLDGQPDGMVDQYDYTYWKMNFGQPSLLGITSSSEVIPEPGSLLLLLTIPLLMPARCRHLSRQ
jgi:hypothetical protein